MSEPKCQQMGTFTATGLVVASMIGIGVYTSLGYQVMGLQSPFALLMLWVVGGVHALCGAFCYAELSTTFPRSGGEYHFLTRIYHPLLGFLAGWVSITAGFAAPIALAAMAFGSYAQAFIGVGAPMFWGVSAILLMAFTHCIRIQRGARVQDRLTVLKILLIMVFIGAGLLVGSGGNPPPVPNQIGLKEVFGGSFALSLMFVTYSYSGWNAATYVASEIRNPKKNLPVAILAGTTFVTLLYVGINYVFIRVTPLEEIQALKDKEAIAALASSHIFGPSGGRLMNGIIATGLLSTLGALVVTGSRIASTLGEDHLILGKLAVRNRHNVPMNAVILQASIALLLLLTSSFGSVLTYVEFVTLLSAFITVIGVYVARHRFPDIKRPFRVPGYPFTPIIYLSIAAWVLWHVFKERPSESLAGLGTLFLGAVVYWYAKRMKTHPPD